MVFKYSNKNVSEYYCTDVRVIGCNVINNRANDENTDCQLECKTENTNPSSVSRFQWKFKQKFTSAFVDKNTNNKYLPLPSVAYNDAGEYRCTATLSGRSYSGTGTVHVSCKLLHDST